MMRAAPSRHKKAKKPNAAIFLAARLGAVNLLVELVNSI
jgi:hypothetical protein